MTRRDIERRLDALESDADQSGERLTIDLPADASDELREELHALTRGEVPPKAISSELAAVIRSADLESHGIHE